MPISYKLTITGKPTYLHPTVTGSNSKENVIRYLREIERECTTRGCFRVLIEERLEGPRLGFMDVFQIAAEASKFTQGRSWVIAYVDVNAAGELMKFAETMAVNRGHPVTVFSSVHEAEEWLLSKDRGGTCG